MARLHPTLLFGAALTNCASGQVRWTFINLWFPAAFFLFSEASEIASQQVGTTNTAASVRVVGLDGTAASVGLLQVRMQGSENGEFGSVCGMNAV